MTVKKSCHAQTVVQTVQTKTGSARRAGTINLFARHNSPQLNVNVYVVSLIGFSANVNPERADHYELDQPGANQSLLGKKNNYWQALTRSIIFLYDTRTIILSLTSYTLLPMDR